MDKLQQLYDRLDTGLQEYLSAWQALPPEELVSRSREITAVRDAHEYLTAGHDLEAAEIDRLLSLPDPLQAVADKWEDRIGDMSDFCFALDEVFKSAEATRRDSAAEKTSVLDKIKSKAALPVQPKPHIPGSEQDGR